MNNEKSFAQCEREYLEEDLEINENDEEEIMESNLTLKEKLELLDK